MNHKRIGMWRSSMFSALLAASCVVPSMATANEALTVVLQDFEASAGGAAAVTTANSSAAANSNSVISREAESSSNRLKITDSDGGTNGAVLTIPGGIPAPGYYLFTADVKVDNASAPISSFGMGVKAGTASAAEIGDENAGYVMNLTGTGDAQLGYQTIGAAINVPAGGSFPQDVTIYFGTDVSGNAYNGPAADGDFAATHRANATPSWAAASSNAVYVDEIKRIGPGNMGEERHLWISVGDAFTTLANLEDALVRAKANNFTHVDILARYRGDAYYVPNRTDATYPNPEPFGTRIGTTPVSPDNDPLQYCIDRCRQLGLKVYISFSCFLVSPNNTYPSTLPADSIMWYQPSTGEARPMTSADNSNEGLWADLGRQDVRDYTKNILMDIVMNYDIDGVVFDRIRYPGTRFGYNPQAVADMGYTSNPSPFSAAFRTSRRDAIAEFLQECYEEVTSKKPWVVMGATPIAFGTGMTDTYNNVFQHWPTWTSRKTANRVVDFGCIDMLQPQFYRLIASGAPEANNTLMKKAKFGDTATDSRDPGLMLGAYTMLAPLMYHPNQGDQPQSAANAQNFTDARLLDLSGFGLFPAIRTLNDMGFIRDPNASTAGTDVLASTPTPVDYLFKAGYDKIGPNVVTNFSASPQSRGSVVFTWDTPATAADGETPEYYYIYKSTTQPVEETYDNLVTKLPAKGNWYHAPVGEAGSYFYKIVPADDYNNRGTATEIGPYTVAGVPATPDDIIVDNLEAAVVGSWSTSSFAADKYGANYRFRGVGSGTNHVTFTASIPATGNWTVSEWHSQGSNRAPDARHLVQHNGGTATVKKDQRSNGGKFNELGTYAFTAGSNYTVTIDDVFTAVSGTVVMADAIKWSYVPAPTVVPVTPTNLLATTLSPSSIKLTWADNATNELGYELERTICGGTTVIIPVPADATSFTDTGLAEDTEYKYVIRAWNTGAQSVDSNVAAARTLPQVEDIIIDDQQATLTGAWSSGSASTDFGVGYRTGFASGDRTATFKFVPERSAVYEVYEWHVQGTNRGTDVPHHVTHSGGTEIVKVNQSINGGKWNKIGQWLFNGEVQQSVMITNKFTVGSVVMADAIKVVYVAEPPTTPAAPSGLSAIAISHEEVGLSWMDNAVNETGYEVVRTKSGGQPEVVAALPADSISYIDTGLTALTQYSYNVRAMNSQGRSPNSNTVTVTTLSSTPADQVIDNQDADLVGDWAFGSFSADKWATNYAFRSKGSGSNRAVFNFHTRDRGLYEIFEWHPQGANRPTDAPHEIVHQYGTDTVSVNQRVNGGQWNSLGIYTFAEAGNYSVAITDAFLTGDIIMADAIKVVWYGEAPADAPAAPSNLEASALGASQVDLTWTDNSDAESAFQVIRNGQLLTTVAANIAAYSDTAASECTSYTYTIRSVVYGRPSLHSNEAVAELDATAPQITAPAAVSVITDSGSAFATAVALGQAQASDNCYGNVTISNNAPAAFPVGQTVVTWTATDSHGNSATAAQTVSVSDTEAPVVTAPADVNVVANTSACIAENVDLGLPVATDNTGVNSVSSDAPTTYPVGATLVTWTITDHHGNRATATQTVTVADNPAQEPATVSASAAAWDKVVVNWADAPNETLYEVRFSCSEAGPYTVAGSTGEDTTSFTIEGLLPDTTYYVVVEARNACGATDGPVASATTPLFSGGADNPESSSNWGSVEDGSAEGGSYVIRARRSTDDAATWGFNAPVSATYRVEVYIPSVKFLSTQANYTITNGPSSHGVVVNQRQNAGSWVALGDFDFVAGAVGISVAQPNNSSNPVVVDGLRANQLN